jgi:hypothetical protein
VLLLPLDRRQIAAGRVQSGSVVVVDPGEDRGAGLGPGVPVAPVALLAEQGPGLRVVSEPGDAA